MKLFTAQEVAELLEITLKDFCDLRAQYWRRKYEQNLRRKTNKRWLGHKNPNGKEGHENRLFDISILDCVRGVLIHGSPKKMAKQRKKKKKREKLDLEKLKKILEKMKERAAKETPEEREERYKKHIKEERALYKKDPWADHFHLGCDNFPNCKDGGCDVRMPSLPDESPRDTFTWIDRDDEYWR